jgi:tetratricopeptide (TPR) repeat protein
VIEAEKIGNSHGVLHGLLNTGTIWKLKARERSVRVFGRLSRLHFLEAVAYAREAGLAEEEVMHSKFLLGQAELALGNSQEAVEVFKEVYAFYQKQPRGKARTGDMERHLGTALVYAGHRREGLSAMERGLAAIRTFDEADSFDKRNYVWEVGALLALSEAYGTEDREKALLFAKEALMIAEKRSLSIRREEAKRLLESYIV